MAASIRTGHSDLLPPVAGKDRGWAVLKAEGVRFTCTEGTAFAVSIGSGEIPHFQESLLDRIAKTVWSVREPSRNGLAPHGVRFSAVRLPGTIHTDGLGGFAGVLANVARRSDLAGYPGDGMQRWPAVHMLDAAGLFRLVLERAEAGACWHAAADEGDAVRDIAAVIGRHLDLPARSVPAESFGPFAPIFLEDQPSSSEYTRQALGWTPTHPSLLKDLESLH